MSSLKKIKAVREAGYVRRCHTKNIGKDYNVANHSYGVVTILLLLHPDPDIELIKAAAFHDTAERWLGDMPSPGKVLFPGLYEAFEKAEEAVLKKLDLFIEISEDEKNWVKAADIIDLWLWCKEELLNGSSTHVNQIRKACERIISRLDEEGKLPLLAKQFCEEVTIKGWRPLSDWFDEA